MHITPDSSMLVASLLIALGCTTTAVAATLYSPPLGGATGHLLACRVTNASTAPRDILIDILQSNGVVALTTNTVRAMFSVEKDVGSFDYVTVLSMPME